MQRVSAPTSSGSIAGNMAIRSWFRPSLRYGSVSSTPLARSDLATVGRVDGGVEVDGADHVAAFVGLGDERRGVVGSTRPSRTGSRRTVPAACREVDAPPRQHPLELVAKRRRWPGPGCCRSGPGGSARARCEVQEAGVQRPDSASSLHPVHRRRGQHRRPQPAVGGEALLGGEVVGVNLGRVEAQPPAPDVASTATRARRRPRAGGGPSSRRWTSRCG